MKYKTLIISCLLILPPLYAAQIASAEVPFPESEQTITPISAVVPDEEIPTGEVAKTTLPMDPTLFAALTGIAGMLIGSLITLSGAYASAKMRTCKCRCKKADNCCTAETPETEAEAEPDNEDNK
jgi:hypothetical protein